MIAPWISRIRGYQMCSVCSSSAVPLAMDTSASKRRLQQSCDSHAEENGPDELAGGPLVVAHTHGVGQQKGHGDRAAEACQVVLQTQKYTQVPRRNIFDGVDHVRPLGVQAARAVQGLGERALLGDAVFRGVDGHELGVLGVLLAAGRGASIYHHRKSKESRMLRLIFVFAFRRASSLHGLGRGVLANAHH